MKRSTTCRQLLLLLLVLPGCGGGGEPTRSIDFIPLSSIEIRSQNPQAAAGTANRFTAVGHYGDPATFQFTRDITGQVAWTSSEPAVLSFDDYPDTAGFATTNIGGAGTATVTATLATISGDLPFTVSDATITTLAIPAPASTPYAGGSLQLRATGTFSDGSSQDLTESVAWSSSEPTVATVTTTGPGGGLVKALAEGTTEISATFDALGAALTLQVSAARLTDLAVSSVGDSASLALGTTMQLLATGTYTDGSTQDLTSQVIWDSSKTTVATIDQNAGTIGRLSSVGTGSATVTAVHGSSTSPGFQVTVTDATLKSLAISPANPALSVGQSLPLSASGDFSNGTSQDLTRDVAWSSDDPDIATVSLSPGFEGIVTGVAVGTVKIRANSEQIPTTGGLPLEESIEVIVQ